MDWAGGILHGDLGMSLTKQVPAWDLLGPALINSLKLALVAFLICVPLSILGGVIAGLRYGKLTDKAITVAGISFAAMPDFVTGIVLILIFSIWLGWLPVTAQGEDGREPPDTGQVPAAAGDDTHARAVRVHRPHHAGRR